MTDRLGQQLGNYRLIRLLGRGGFAEVYLGEHIHLETKAAIKVLHTQVNSNDTELFRKEARTIARLENPRIVRVLEFGVENSSPLFGHDLCTKWHTPPALMLANRRKLPLHSRASAGKDAIYRIQESWRG